jgi:hypothetical protein
LLQRRYSTARKKHMNSMEYLYHYSCEKCKLWWSIAMEKDKWQPKVMWCPHCGNKKEYFYEIDYEYMRQ